MNSNRQLRWCRARRATALSPPARVSVALPLLRGTVRQLRHENRARSPLACPQERRAAHLPHGGTLIVGRGFSHDTKPIERRTYRSRRTSREPLTLLPVLTLPSRSRSIAPTLSVLTATRPHSKFAATPCKHTTSLFLTATIIPVLRLELRLTLHRISRNPRSRPPIQSVLYSKRQVKFDD
jgi:hypothetical protein